MDKTCFQQAYALCQSPNPFLSYVSYSLYKEMNKRFMEERFSPDGDFNILYFFQSVIRLLISEHTALAIRAKKIELQPCKIMAGNIPSHLAKWKASYFVESKLAAKYLELVHSDSSPDGASFDLTYALEVQTSVIDGEFIDQAMRATDINLNDSDFDEDLWLSGFFERD